MTIENVRSHTYIPDNLNGTGTAVVPGERTPGDVVERVKALLLEVTQLKVARDSNRRIGMAMGIAMNHLQIDESQAFDALRRTSQNTNRKLKDVAEDVIRDGHI